MTKQTYNGWMNWETWAVNIWIENDEGTQGYWADRAQCLLEQHLRNQREEGAAEEAAVFDLADEMQEQHEDALPELTGFAADLLDAAMSEVNWREIARALVEAAKEEANA